MLASYPEIDGSLYFIHLPQESRDEGGLATTDLANYCYQHSLGNLQVYAGQNINIVKAEYVFIYVEINEIKKYYQRT